MDVYNSLYHTRSSSDSLVRAVQAIISTKEYPSKGQKRSSQKGLQSVSGDRTPEVNKEKDQGFEGWA